MKRFILLHILLLSAVCVIADNRKQQTEFELSEQLDGHDTYIYEASSYIKLLDGFKSNPGRGGSSCFSINRYGVYPPENGVLGGPSTSARDGVVGALPGYLNVSDIGGAVYSVPLQLPKGLGDMTPDLAITYNNQAGNGLLGWAWNITGLSSIERVGATKYHDGINDKVKFDEDDRFVLDGKRLMLSCSQSYGENGATYRTEIDDMTKVISHTSNPSNGPSYFVAYKSDGTIWEYGHTADSYVMIQNGNGPAMSWRINKVSDRDGNSIVFRYDNNNAEGESYVSHIEYTLNEEQGVNSMYDVEFLYEDRTDIEAGYVYQNVIKIKRLLAGIVVRDKTSGKELMSYSFDYLNPGKYNNVYYSYNRLKSITLVADGMKLNPTVIAWNKNSKHFNDKFQSYTLNKNVFNKVPFIGDFNGDGLSDVLLVPYKTGYYYNNDVTAHIYINNGDGTFETSPRYSFVFDKTLEWVYVVDFDGDGLSDVVPYYCNKEQSPKWRSKTAVYLNKGDVSFRKLGNDISNECFFYMYPGDFSGEHKTSFYVMYDGRNYKETNSPSIIFYRNGNVINQMLGLDANVCTPDNVVVVDIDGDGKQEIVKLLENKAVVSELRMYGSTYFNIKKYVDERLCSEDYLFPGDFNGDGNMDLLKYNQRNRWTVMISDGRFFLPAETFSNSQLLTGVSLVPRDRYSYSLSRMKNPTVTIRTADFDGDGKCDVGVMKSAAGNNYMVVGTNMYRKETGGYDFRYTNRYYMGINFGHQYVHVGDFLGQENKSILGSAASSSSNSIPPKIVALNPHSAMYSVERVVDGLGNAHGFAYDYLVPYKGNSMYSFEFKWVLDDVRTISMPIRVLKSDTVFSTNGSRCYNNYKYDNLWYHLDGKGVLGHHHTEVCTMVNGKQTTRKFTEFEMETMGSFIMPLPKKMVLFDSNDKKIAEDAFGYKKFVSSLNPKIVMPVLESNHKTSYNLDGNLDVMKVELTVNEYVGDAGDGKYVNCVNLTKSICGTDKTDRGTKADAYNFHTTTEYKYNNDVDKWVVNRVGSIRRIKSMKNGSFVGNGEKFVYSNVGNPLRVVRKTSVPNITWNDSDPLTVNVTYSYDKVGNIVSQVQTTPSATKRQTKVEYSSNYKYRYPTAFINEKGWRTSMSYSDNFGLSLSTVDYNNFEMNNASNILGITSVSRMPDGVENVKTKRWAAGHKHAPSGAMYYCWDKSTGRAESLVFYHKDGTELRNVTFDLNGEAVYVDMTYDDFGNMSSRSLPYIKGENKKIVYFIYDKYNRIVEEVFPNGLKHEYTYSKYSKTMKTITPEGEMQKKTETTNEMGWVVGYVDVGGNSMSFEYYADGLLKSSKVGGNSATKVSYEYDHRGNKSKMIDPSCGTIRYEYDAYGNLLKMSSQKNGTTTYNYDPSGLLLSRKIVDANGDVVETQWIYDNTRGRKGTLKHIAHGTSHLTDYSYDAMLYLESVSETIDGERYETFYEYDPAGREMRKTYPSGMVVENRYSNSGFLKSLYDAEDDKMLWNSISADAAGNLTDYQIGNGLHTRLGYDEDLKYLNSIYTYNNKKTFQNYSYQYDDFGNLINRSKYSGSMVSESFEYDGFNRLVGVKRNGKVTGKMSYDIYGNMTEKTINGVSMFYDGEYNGSDPYAIRSAKTEIDQLNGLSHTVEYTAFDKIKSAANDRVTMKFSYDSELNRDKMLSVCDGVTTEKVYVGDCEFVEKGNSRSVYTFLSGPLGVFAVACIDGQGDKAIFYVHKDHLDSWCLITNEDAEVVQSTSYDAWGNPRNANTWSGDYNGNLLFDRGFTGHEHIISLGLINMNGRVYDPLLSMMLSPDNYIQDQYFSQNYNRYRYCYNNPLSYNDPTGDVAEWIIEGIFWGFVNVISNLDVIDGFGEGALVFAAGFVCGSLTHGLGSCSWAVQVICGVGASVIQAGVNNFVSQNDGSFNWSAIDMSSLKEDMLYAFGYGLASSMLNAYIVYPTEETPGVSLGTLICDNYEKGHILDTSVSGFVGNLFANRNPLENFNWTSLGVEWGSVIPNVVEFLSQYCPDSDIFTLLGMFEGYDWLFGNFFGGGNNNSGGDGSGKGHVVNAVKVNTPMVCRANLDAPACYSNVRSFILNK